MNNTYQILKCKATSKINQIIVTPGDWNQRDQNTFCKIKPNQEDMQILKSIATELITSDPKTQPTQFLWEANCAIYSVAYTWKTKHQKTRIIQQNRNKFKPKWMKHIESQMNLLRREISQITEEIKRLKTNGKITRIAGRNRTVAAKARAIDRIFEIFNCWRQTSSQWSGCWREAVKAHITRARRDVMQKHMSHSFFSSKMESFLAPAEGKFC